MLPRSLTIQNFLSYGPEPQVLDFREFDLACLVGQNGVGKSSLIEALTWCLWGKARSGADNELVHLGAKAMSVAVELEAGGETYRVIRKRSVRGKGGTSLLEFQIHEGADGAFRAITTPSIRETQALITRTLGFSYETFINSAYLRQGRADEFTTKRPAERKAILAEILGLQTYETLEHRVRTQLAEQDEQSNARTFFLEQLRQDIADLPVLEAQALGQEETVTAARALLTVAESALAAQQERLGALALRKERADATQQEAATLAADLRELEEERERLQRETTDTEALLAERTQIEEAAAAAKKAQSGLAHWNDKRDKAHALERERFALERSVAELRRVKEERLTTLRGQAALLAERRAVLDEEQARLRDAGDPEQPLQEARDALAAAEAGLATAREQSRAAKADADAAQTEGETVKTKRAALGAGDATCPLCTQELSPEHHARVDAEYDATLAACRTRYVDATQRGTNAAAAQTDYERAITTARPRILQLERERDALAALRARGVEAEHTATQLGLLERELEALQAAPVPPEEESALAELATLERKGAMLGYDPEAHALVEREATDTAPALDRLATLSTAEERLEALRAQQTALLERMNIRKERLALLDAERMELVRSMEGETLVQRAAADALAQVDHAREHLRDAEHTSVDMRSRLTALREKAIRAAATEEELGAIGERRSLLDELRQCFGRNGIPAMLIEAAIPEIEERANDVLGRMTDHQFTIRLDVTREKRSGAGSVETLDIRIADNVGTRDYELYSGGEAFRINFAIRIALSHLLARRAGAELRLLVIDEGFGTLDTLGRETLVGVLNAIRSEFEKILVITHIQELKDAFSYQIKVEKRAEGSVLVRE